jgi:DNA-binding beta-propeller fold protein YncE
VIESLTQEFVDSIDRTPLVAAPDRAGTPNTVLSYPGKVTVGDGILYVSDTAHHRIVAAQPETGEIVAVYGRGRAGFENGIALEARFDSPQGLAFDDATGTLYVADTNNHAIRTVDVATGEVETLAGTGRLGWPPAASLLPDARLNSPWGLTLFNGDLWIAMAGFHQIWVADLDGGTISPAVGSSTEGTENGALVAASLAQPSGLAFDGSGRLYFADSESSSIRWADVGVSDGQTGTLAGSDATLFDFGDQDGTGTDARLQHPLGIAWDEEAGDLIVADTYNNKLKRIDPATGDTVTYLGGTAGWSDGTDPQFYEPGGLAIAGGILYVADTNNHVLREVDLATGTVETLVLHGIEGFSPPPDDADYTGTIVDLETAEVSPGSGEIVLDIQLPDGYKVNPDAPSSIAWTATEDVAELPAESDLTGAELPVSLPVEFTGTGAITADLTLLYCREDSEGLCIIEQVRFRQPISVTASGDSRLVLPHDVILPDF